MRSVVSDLSFLIKSLIMLDVFFIIRDTLFTLYTDECFILKTGNFSSLRLALDSVIFTTIFSSI